MSYILFHVVIMYRTALKTGENAEKGKGFSF